MHNVGPNGECRSSFKDIFKVVEELKFEPHLILSIEDIFADNIKEWNNCPTVFWGMETMHHHEGHMIRGKMHDYCFINDLVRWYDFKGKGLKCEFMSFAVSDKIWDYASPKEIDIAYVGRLGKQDTDYYKERWDYFKLLQEDKFWDGRILYKDQQSRFEDYVRETSKGRIQWNFDSKDHLSERHWEGMALGCAFFNYVTGIEDVVVENAQALFYRGKDDMRMQAYDLVKSNKADGIWWNSKEWIKARHTYKNRIQRILEVSIG